MIPQPIETIPTDGRAVSIWDSEEGAWICWWTIKGVHRLNPTFTHWMEQPPAPPTVKTRQQIVREVLVGGGFDTFAERAAAIVGALYAHEMDATVALLDAPPGPDRMHTAGRWPMEFLPDGHPESVVIGNKYDAVVPIVGSKREHDAFNDRLWWCPKDKWDEWLAMLPEEA